jgi:hypothetical protein
MGNLGMLSAFPPGMQGYLAADQMRGQRQRDQLGLLGSLTQLQGAQMQQQELQRKIGETQKREALMAQYASQLPEGERQAFMLSPENYIKERVAGFNLRPGETRFRGNQPVVSAPEAAYTMSPGQVRMRGNEQLAALPANPSLVNVPVPGRPGIEQPTWLRPGETAGTPVGGLKMPDILNPEVRDAKRSVASAGATRVTVNPMRETFKDEQALRNEYTDASKSFVKLAEGYSKVKGALASDPSTSAPATLAAATQFMKMLDPESVVRESELGMALSSAGIWDRFTNIYNTIQSGKVLTPNQAKEFGRIADVVYEAANRAQQGRVQHFQGLAKSYNFDANRVVPDLTPRPDVAMKRRATDAVSPPTKGEVRDGWEFMGGDPANRMSWRKAK